MHRNGLLGSLSVFLIQSPRIINGGAENIHFQGIVPVVETNVAAINLQEGGQLEGIVPAFQPLVGGSGGSEVTHWMRPGDHAPR